MVLHWSRIAVAVLSVGIGMSSCSRNLSVSTEAQAATTPSADATVSTPVSARLVSGLPDFTTLVDRYGPAVVNVAVIEKDKPVRELSNNAPGGTPDPFFEFFKRFGNGGGGGNGSGGQPSRGQGSGFIISPDGYILTNAHVVEDAGVVTVRTTDRREYTAQVIGVDEPTDVAVIKIEAKDLPTVRLGDPSKLKPGEWVIAIGSPFGFENSVTAGIVSATARSMGATYASFIQTDVAVNPGNSGGPLFNLDGEVVDINSQIYSRTGGYMGLSFAVPIDIANNVRQQLVSTGKVTRSRIGVNINDVNAGLAESFGLDRPRGALISGVMKDSPGAKAGLKQGDVILKVGDTLIEKSLQVPAVVSNQKPGSAVNLEIWRDGKPKQVTVRPEEIVPEAVQRASLRSNGEQMAGKLGLTLRELTNEEKQRVETAGSLLVEEVTGAAARAGVLPGDIILGVASKGLGTRKVDSVKDLKDATKTNAKAVALLIQRDGGEQYVAIPLG